MLSHLYRTKDLPHEVLLLYASHVSESGEPAFLFRHRLERIARLGLQFRLQLYVTGKPEIELPEKGRIQWRRINHADLIDAVGSPEDRAGVVCYVCGPPPMTDDFVSFLRQVEGMDEQRVLCEKWW